MDAVWVLGSGGDVLAQQSVHFGYSGVVGERVREQSDAESGIELQHKLDGDEKQLPVGD